MEDIEAAAMLYALSIKGGYYKKDGQITDLLTEAQFFLSKHDAICFRNFYDPQHHVEQSTLLKLTVFISEID